MTKWEYCQITWTVAQVPENAANAITHTGAGQLKRNETDGKLTWRLGYLTFLGSTIESKPIDNTDSVLATLGQEGWELVSHTYLASPVPLEKYLFKRPLDNG
jgi:hypothetical protein